MDKKLSLRKYAQEMDAQDHLKEFRNEFMNNDPQMIYMDGNSLGRLPLKTISTLDDVIMNEWGTQLIRSWNNNWVNAPSELGAKISQLIGANPDEVLVTDTTSTNLFKLATAGLYEKPGRKKIVSDVFNFPSDLYILQGVAKYLNQGHYIELIPSSDDIHIDIDRIKSIIDHDTALVSLSHVAFKSAYMYDMSQITETAHKAGAIVLWDLSHSTGSVPVNLNLCNVDLAVGCTYKYLNGGPGSPAYLYVHRDLQPTLQSPIWGWFADASPFSFKLEFTPTPDIRKFSTGTPHILSMKAISPALDLLLEANIQRLREKSVLQTDYLISLADEWLIPIGFGIGSPRDPKLRGSHISLKHPDAYQINQNMIYGSPSGVKVIPDFREPDNIRLGIAPIYTSFEDIFLAIEAIREIAEQNTYKGYSKQRSAVT